MTYVSQYINIMLVSDKKHSKILSTTAILFAIVENGVKRFI